MVNPAHARCIVPALLLLAAAPAAGQTPGLGAEVEGYAAAACLTRQEQPFLRDEGHLWAAGIMERVGGSLDHWVALADAVGAEAARRPMPVARVDGPERASSRPMPVLFCHELVRTPAVRAAIKLALRRLRTDRPGR